MNVTSINELKHTTKTDAAGGSQPVCNGRVRAWDEATTDPRKMQKGPQPVSTTCDFSQILSWEEVESPDAEAQRWGQNPKDSY